MDAVLAVPAAVGDEDAGEASERAVKPPCAAQFHQETDDELYKIYRFYIAFIAAALISPPAFHQPEDPRDQHPRRG